MTRKALAHAATSIALGLAIALAASTTSAEEAAPLGRFDYAPYQVGVSVSFARDPAVTPAFRDNVTATLAARIGQSFGSVWNLIPGGHVRQDDALTPANTAGLARLTYSEAAAHWKDSPCEKAYLFVVRPEGPRWIVAGREWDKALQTFGPVAQASTLERGAVADEASLLLQKLFTPLLIVDDADRNSQSATLTVRAGSIPFADSHMAPLKKGALLQPVFRFLDAKHEVRKIQPVPWTYLAIDDIQNGRAKCTVVSSYRAPLAANLRRRVDAVATLLRPELPETEITLLAGRKAPQPLAGTFVWLTPTEPGKSLSAGKTGPPPIKLMSDRHGVVRVPNDPQHVLRSLEVRSGSAILARRPFVPGVEAAVTLELADDSLRLGTERDVDLLCGQLIETVARRASLIGRGRIALNRNDFTAAKKVLADFDHLPSVDDYLSQLNKIRVVGMEDAHRQKDRLAERRIDDLCQKTKPLIEQYLASDRIQTIKEEITTALAALQPMPPQTAPGEKTPAAKGEETPSPSAASKNSPAADKPAPTPAPPQRGRRRLPPPQQAPSEAQPAPSDGQAAPADENDSGDRKSKRKGRKNSGI